MVRHVTSETVTVYAQPCFGNRPFDHVNLVETRTKDANVTVGLYLSVMSMKRTVQSRLAMTNVYQHMKRDTLQGGYVVSYSAVNTLDVDTIVFIP